MNLRMPFLLQAGRAPPSLRLDESLLYPQKTGTFHLKLVRELWESDAESGTAAALLGIEGFAGRPVRTYSQGMKRQLLLAMAYASQASYILLDEPLNALDPDKAERGCAALFRMAEEGASILVASHQPEELDRICDSYMVFKGTKLAVVPKQGSCRELFHRCYRRDAERRG